MRTVVKLGVLVWAGLIPGLLAHAQFLPEPLALVASPTSPSPGEAFVVEVSAPAMDKNASYFSWAVDRKSRSDLSGLGKSSISLVAGELGSDTRIDVGVLRAGGGIAGTATLTIRTADLTLYWYAETYTPRWYKGRALAVQNSVVNVVAIPNIIIRGRAARPENLIYRWSLDDEDNVLIGAGKDIFRIRTSDLPKSSHYIKVAVEDVNKIVRKEGIVNIVPVLPRTIIYSSSPLGGIESRHAPMFLATGKRGILDWVAESFFFPVSSRKNLSYRWTVGGGAVGGTPENPYFLTIDTGAKPATLLPITVSVNDKDDLIPSAYKLLTLLLQ